MKSSTYRHKTIFYSIFINVSFPFTFLIFTSFQKPYPIIKNKTYAISSPYNLKCRLYHYKIQNHTHSKNNYGSNEPSEVMKKYEPLEYVAVAITDHDGEWRGFYPSLEDPRGHHIINILGIEYWHKDVIDNKKTSWGNMVSIGISTIYYNEGEGDRKAQIERAKSEGELSFWVHPDYRTRILKDAGYEILDKFDNYAGTEVFMHKHQIRLKMMLMSIIF